MILDFKSATLPEGLTVEMLQDSGVQSYINEAIDAQKSAAVSQMQVKLDAAVLAKSIADQKAVDLRGKIDENKNNKKPGNNTEHTAELIALQSQLDDKNADVLKLNTKLDRADVSAYLNSEMAAYNAANPTVRIASGAEDYVLDAALATFKKNESGQIVPMNGDTVLTGNGGFMSVSEFISNFRAEKPVLFSQPSGGGASGNSSGGAGGDNAKYFKKGDDFNLTKQAELRASNPDEYQRLKNAA